jgi:hypothetical protein
MGIKWGIAMRESETMELPYSEGYDETRVLSEIRDYIGSTYVSHYTNDNNDIQVLDIYRARGTMTNTCIDNSLKYLMRYGKKNGSNRDDLLKAVHYIILALGNESH